MTITGLVLLPVYLVVILLPWRYVLVTLVLSCLLSSAAIFNVGNIGLQPTFCFMLLVIGRTAVEIGLGRQALGGYALRVMAPLGALLVISTVTLLLSIIFFTGRIEVMSGSAGFQLILSAPYSFRRENVAQIGYLLIDTAAVYAVAHHAAYGGEKNFSRVADVSLVIAGYASGLVALWELTSFYTHLPFPFAFFHSNAGYAAAYGQTFGDIPRISGPFPEPSAVGYFFGGMILFAWLRYRAVPTAWSLGLLLLSVTTLLISTATTSYAALALFLLVVLKDMSVRSRPYVRRLLDGGKREWTLAATFLVGAGVIAVYVIQEWSTLYHVFDLVVVEKKDSVSFDARAGADLMAWNILLDTHGIGVGLGSHRPNNLVTTLLSNVGVLGTAAFALFLFQLFRPTPAMSTHSTASHVAKRLRAFVIGLLLMHTFSNPELTDGQLWLGFALFLGALTEMRRRTARESPPSGVPSTWRMPLGQRSYT